MRRIRRIRVIIVRMLHVSRKRQSDFFLWFTFELATTSIRSRMTSNNPVTRDVEASLEIEHDPKLISENQTPCILPISNPGPVEVRTVRLTLVCLFGCVGLYETYGLYLSSYMSFDGRLLATPALVASIPLLVMAPIFGSMFKTDMKGFILVGCLMMTWFHLPILFLNSYLASFSSMWVIAYVNAGLLEEFLKALIYLIPLWKGRIKYSYQVIYYAAMAGLLFGVGENVLSGTQFWLADEARRGLGGTDLCDLLTRGRLFLIPMLHIIITVLGACIIAYTLSGIGFLSRRWIACCLAILVSSVVHGTYDALYMAYDGKYAIVSNILAVVALLTVLSLMLYLRELDDRAREQAPAF